MRLAGRSVHAQLVTLVVVAAFVPMLAATVAFIVNARRDAQADARIVLDSRAAELASAIRSINQRDLQLTIELASRDTLERLAAAPSSPEHRAAVAAAFERLRERHPTLLRLAVLGADGSLLFDTHPDAPLASPPRLDEVSTGQALVHGKPAEATAAIAHAAPVRDGAHTVRASVVLITSASPLERLFEAQAGAAGKGSLAVLIDSDGIRIGHSSRPDLLFAPVVALAPTLIERATAQQRFGEQTRQRLTRPERLAGALGWTELRELRGNATRIFLPGNEEWNLATARPLEEEGWTLVYALPESALYQRVNRQIAAMAIAGGLLALFALLAGRLIGRRILVAVEALADAAKRFAAGDRAVRLEAVGSDELALVGRAFNSMADRIAHDQQILESEVQARTRELSEANHTLGDRNAQLAHRERLAVASSATLAALSGSEAFDRLIGAALDELVRSTGAALAICYRAVGNDSFEPVAATGAFGVEAFTGGLARAVTERDGIHTLRPLPEDLEVRFDAVIGMGKPRALLLSALRSGERVVGLLALGLLEEEHPIAPALMTTIGPPLALTLQRAELFEQRNRLAEELGHQNQELQAQAEELRAREEELRLQQRMLEVKNAEVEKANRLKSEFLANMSHELRTPLNTIIGFSDLLFEDGARSLDGTQRQHLEHIRLSGRHLLSLINTVLDLAKIEAGHMGLEAEEVDCAAAVREALALIEPQARARRIHLEEALEHAPVVAADPGKLRQILLNLLSNAVKFTPEGGRVTVGAKGDGAVAELFVRDTGPGIPEKMLPLLFRPFVQGESPLIKRHHGTGLGLAISRKLADLHGGDLRVQKTGESGTTFSLTLPLARGLVHPTPKPSPQPPQQKRPPAPPPSGTVVLAIDDDPAVGGILSAILTPEGYSVHVALEAELGFTRALELRPSVIFLDLKLRETSGAELLARFAADERTRKIPVIVLTGAPLSDEERAALLPHARAVAQKGDFTRSALIETLAGALGSMPAATGDEIPTLLLVEDHDLNRTLARTVLERIGYRVLEANSGAAALDAARAHQPDLILMDLSMPVMDGFTTARQLKADATTASIPVIALTARSMRSDEDRARAEGFVGYVTKPFEVPVLAAAIAQALSGGSAD